MKIHRNVLWRGGVVIAMGCWTTALAEDSAEYPVLTVLGQSYTSSNLCGHPEANERQLLWSVSEKIYEAVHKPNWGKDEFQVSEEELKDFCRRQTPTPAEMGSTLMITNVFAATWATWQGEGKEAKEARACATMQISEWKIQKYFFNRYGGRVFIDPFCIPIAFDAVCTYLAEQESGGTFTIHDEALRALYWERVHMLPKEPLLSEEEGRAAFAEDPAVAWKRRLLGHIQKLDASRNSSNAE